MKYKLEKRGKGKHTTYVPLLKDFEKELKDVLRQKIDFVINNSNYQIDHLVSVDFEEFYEIVFLVQRALTQKAKQV